MIHIHINQPSGHFIGQVRRRNARRWRTVTGRRSTAHSALAAAVMAMGDSDYKARVLFIDASGWYEPMVCMEAKA